jgi:hypothetical protein
VYARRHIIAISIVTAAIIAMVVLAIMVTTVVIVVERTLPLLDETPFLISSFDSLLF